MKTFSERCDRIAITMAGIEKALIEAAEVIGYARDFVDGYIDVVDGD